MSGNDSSRRYERGGIFFQFLLISAFVYRTDHFMEADVTWPSMAVSALGTSVFAYCLIVLYVKRAREKNLITTSVFRYTRHPMYTGLVLMDFRFWFSEHSTAAFLFSAVLFYAGLLVAGYFQERETLARFGDEARAYYARTPRLFFLYPFKKFMETPRPTL